ncbi:MULTISPECIES: hypothetical protein [Pseudomonadota]|uniref:hypothetical protein n=1 Tax=Pseudomonadota TaxID=1224 RepID=UPI000897C9B6|nr:MULTISPECIES: hypothetical protein [Pseudomonadota]SEF14494.1 hypothetical protein SAMN02787142_8320 [Burkholderia sp. WP9]SEP48094.1 hypothetical protein SAMN02787149_13410 [Pseudomonas sp. Snoq117.2]
MSNLATLYKAACDASAKFIAARDELVKAETAYNEARKTAPAHELNAVETHRRPLNFSNTVCTDC